MKKVIKLTERDIIKLVKKVISEQDETNFPEPDPQLYAIAMNDVRPNPQDAQLAEDDDEDLEYDDEEIED